MIIIITSSSSSTNIPTVSEVQPDTDMVRQLLLWNGHDSRHLLGVHGRHQSAVGSGSRSMVGMGSAQMNEGIMMGIVQDVAVNLNIKFNNGQRQAEQTTTDPIQTVKNTKVSQ